MSAIRICDWCKREIPDGEVYYMVNQKSNGNMYFKGDRINDICFYCAKKLSVDLDHEYKEEEEVIL